MVAQNLSSHVFVTYHKTYIINKPETNRKILKYHVFEWNI